MSAADPAAALCAYLLSSPAAALVDNRLFRPRLPEAQIASMPEACIVVHGAGGYQMYGRATVPLSDPRLDVLCYGSTWLEARNVADEVTLALQNLRQSVWGGVRLYWARIEVGPLEAEDPDTHWPAMVVSAQVLHGRQPVT